MKCFTLFFMIFVLSFTTIEAAALEVDTESGLQSLIENIVLGRIPDPVGDIVNTVRAAPQGIKAGTLMWLKRKMSDAVMDDDMARLDRYQAFYSCLATGDCADLQKLQLSRANDSQVAGSELTGSWLGCDGRIITFIFENGEYVGRYTSLGTLGRYGFFLNEIGYRCTMDIDGKCKGKVKWRWTDGRQKWKPNIISVSGDHYTDTGSDPCSNNMRRR